MVLNAIIVIYFVLKIGDFKFFFQLNCIKVLLDDFKNMIIKTNLLPQREISATF